MTQFKNLKMEDITPWHGDVFDHPDYKYICKISGKEVIPYIHCKNNRCKNYECLCKKCPENKTYRSDGGCSGCDDCEKSVLCLMTGEMTI